MSVGTLLADSSPINRRKTWTKKRVALLVGGVIGLVGGLVIVLLGRWPMLQVVETGRTPEYPYLEPRSFAERPEIVFDRACDVMKQMDGWTLTNSDRDEGIIHATVVRTLFWFRSETTIHIRLVDGLTKVDIRSETVGYNRDVGDFGQNARNVRQFFKALEAVVNLEASEGRPGT